jgi:hypothetical protein
MVYRSQRRVERKDFANQDNDEQGQQRNRNGYGSTEQAIESAFIHD